ncbi:MAG: hypothetical protein AB1435_01885 [Chloroflexota bacterium]
MSQRSIVQRLIAFLKRPDALGYQPGVPPRHSYDDFAPREYDAAVHTPDGSDPLREPPHSVLAPTRPALSGYAPRPQRNRLTPPPRPLRYDDAPREPRERPAYAPPPSAHESARAPIGLAVQAEPRQPGYASRLDALVMRALQQFSARFGFIIRYDDSGRMRYVTGRDIGGRYVEHTAIAPDRRALAHTLRTGESNLFVQRQQSKSGAVLCGPVRVNGEVVGALYLDGPAQGRLYRGIFEIFCDQIARLLTDEAA